MQRSPAVPSPWSDGYIHGTVGVPDCLRAHFVTFTSLGQRQSSLVQVDKLVELGGGEKRRHEPRTSDREINGLGLGPVRALSVPSVALEVFAEAPIRQCSRQSR